MQIMKSFVRTSSNTAISFHITPPLKNNVSKEHEYKTFPHLGFFDVVDVRGVHEGGEIVKLLPDLRPLVSIVAGKWQGSLEV